MRASPQDNSAFLFASSSELSNLFSGTANARDSRAPGAAEAAPTADVSASGSQGTSGGGGVCCLLDHRVLLLV